MFIRKQSALILQRLREPRRFIQVLSGPRQVGKTTLMLQVIEQLGLPCHDASADSATVRDQNWIIQQWEIGRLKIRESSSQEGAVLVLDEVQKIPDWSETVKWLWDEDTRHKRPLRVMILGSSPLLLQKGLSESLAGRFELIPVTHWTFEEMREAFDFSFEQFLFFGGYPGAAPLIHDEPRWRHYLLDSLIETTLSRDILLTTTITKPALLRRLFQLACDYSGEILSYTKMLGQLQDAGNTVTLAHYLQLLSGAGLATGLMKFSGKKHLTRSSSPKLQVLNTALMSAMGDRSFSEAQIQRDYWGRLMESAIGAYLMNEVMSREVELYYWREDNKEVDFVVKKKDFVLALEVKSGKRRECLPGMELFAKRFKVNRRLLVGHGGIPPEEFLTTPLEKWVSY